MRKLSLSEWSSIADIIATVAVVVSLIFVAFSLEKNTTVLSGQGEDDIYDRVSDIHFVILANPDLLDVYRKGRDNFVALTAREREQYELIMARFLDLWDRAIQREKQGLIQPGDIEPWQTWFEDFVGRHVNRAFWEEIKWGWPGRDFQKRVEAAIAKHETAMGGRPKTKN